MCATTLSLMSPPIPGTATGCSHTLAVGCGWYGSGWGRSSSTSLPPGPPSCVHGRAASTLRMLQDPKLQAVPPRKVAPPRGLPARTTGVSVHRCTEQTLRSDGPASPSGDSLSSSLFPPSAGRGHQVHKSWPISISDPEVGLDASSGKEVPECMSCRGVPGQASLVLLSNTVSH